jgi:hypothetical protein
MRSRASRNVGRELGSRPLLSFVGESWVGKDWTAAGRGKGLSTSSFREGPLLPATLFRLLAGISLTKGVGDLYCNGSPSFAISLWGER